MIQKKYIFTTLCLSIVISMYGQQEIRNSIAIVRPQYDNHREKFLTDFATSLRFDGYVQSSEILNSYVKEGIANGVAFADKKTGKIYIMTVRDAVAQANSVDIEFSDKESGVTLFRNCPVAAIDPFAGLAIIGLPEAAKLNTESFITFSSQKIEDGTDVFSAGYPLLGKSPSWQLSKGIVSNSSFQPTASKNKSVPLIQHTAQTAISNAGSPLLVRNKKYEIVGINVWKTTGRENVNFAIPTQAASDFIARFFKTSSAEQPTPDLKAAIQSLFLSSTVSDKNGYADVLPYISRDYVYSLSAYAYYNLSKAATPDAQAAVKPLLTWGNPLEAFRILVADAIVQQLALRKFSISHLGDVDVKSGHVPVELKEGNNLVSTIWVQEEDGWKMSNFSGLDIKKIAESQKKAVPETFRLSWYITMGVGYPLRNNEKLRYGLQLGTLFLDYIPVEVAYYRSNLDKQVVAGYDPKTDKENYELQNMHYGFFEARLGLMYPLKVNRTFYVIPALKGLLRFEEDNAFSRWRTGVIVQMNGVYRINNAIGLLFGCGYNHYFSLKDGTSSPEYLQPVGGIEINAGIAF